MRAKKSTLTKLGLPVSVGVLLFTVDLVLLLAPYLPEADLGTFKIPALPVATRHALQYLGPVVFIAATLLFFKFWPEPVAVTVRSAGTFTPTKLRFRNSSRSHLNIDWIDLDGKKDPLLHQVLAPGESIEVSTFVAHVWSVTNANTGVEIKTVTAASGPSEVTIR